MTPSPASPATRTFSVSGMTCRSCELLVERLLKALPQVADARARLASHTVEITPTGAACPNIARLNAALAGSQYRLSAAGVAPAIHTADASSARGTLYWLEVGLTLAVLLVLAHILKSAGFLPSAGAVSDGAVVGWAGFASIAVIGLAAASSSCLALVGGLLLSVSAKWVQSHPQANGWQKLQPLLLFNAGRLAGYFLLGGFAGLLGLAFGLSTRLTGLLTVALAAVMLIVGANILGILPKRYCSVPLPRSMMRRVQGLSSSGNPAMPMLLGALTFFVPCGFTQSMQLLALGSGSFLAGGLIMFTFALGTLPALLGISVIGSYVRGEFQRWFLIVAGSATVLLGFGNLQSGLLLMGIDAQDVLARSLGQTEAQLFAEDSFVTVDAEGRQIVSLYVRNDGYQPSSFTVDPRKPTWIYAIAEGGVSGCASMITVPAFRLQAPVRQGGNWLGPFTPEAGETVTITCSMGMLRADLHVRPS